MSDEARPITIVDVAADLGLSSSTVSRALTKPELLSEETRTRVLEAVERLGYRPNLLARDLRRRQTRVAFVVVPSLSPFFLEVFRGVDKAAQKIGYSVVMGHTERDPAREQLLLDQVGAGRADGIILVTSSQSPFMADAKQRLPPIVVALEQPDGCFLPTVRVDHTAAAVVATKHLLDLGHTRIAHISGPMSSPMATHRLDGFRRAMGARLDPALCIHGDFTIDGGQSAMEILLGRPKRPTAVFAANDEMAIGAIRAVKSAGLRVPDDISVVGFDDQRLGRVYDPSLTTIHLPSAEIGYRAMLMLERVLSNTLDNSDIVLRTHLEVRDTTRAITREARAPRSRSAQTA